MSSKLLTNIFCTIIFLRLALFTLHTIPIWFPNSVFRTDCLCCNFEGGEFGSICSNSVVNIWYNVDLTNDISLCTSGFDCSCKKIPPPTQQTNNYTYTAVPKSGVSKMFVFLKENNTFIQQGCSKLSKTDSKD